MHNIVKDYCETIILMDRRKLTVIRIKAVADMDYTPLSTISLQIPRSNTSVTFTSHCSSIITEIALF